MDRYSILLGKKPLNDFRKGIDLSNKEFDETSVSLWVKGQTYLIADSPKDVTVVVNGRVVSVSSVNGTTGEVVLKEVPENCSDLMITYYYNKEKCIQKSETVLIFNPLNSVFYVSRVPIVKCEISVKRRYMIYADSEGRI